MGGKCSPETKKRWAEANADKMREHRKANKENRYESSRKFHKTPGGVFSRAYGNQKISSEKRGHPDPDYSMLDLRDRFINDPIFVDIFEKWENGGYNKKDKPSFDRIDHTKPYSLDNIQVMRFEDNEKKGAIESKESKFRPIDQLDMNGNLIKSFKSSKEASIETGCDLSDIARCAKGIKKQVKGFLFRYPEGFVPPERPKSEKILFSIIQKSISDFGYYCHQIGYNTGFVRNMKQNDIYPCVFEIEPLIGNQSYFDNFKKICQKHEYESVIISTHRTSTKVYFRNFEDMIKGVRDLSLFDKSLTEIIKAKALAEAGGYAL